MVFSANEDLACLMIHGQIYAGADDPASHVLDSLHLVKLIFS